MLLLVNLHGVKQRNMPCEALLMIIRQQCMAVCLNNVQLWVKAGFLLHAGLN